MRNNILSFTLLLFSGCGVIENSNQTTTSHPDPPEIKASDIALALSVNYFFVKIPNDETGVNYGFSYASKDGIAGTGRSVFRPGEIVKVFYWEDGSDIKFTMIGNGISLKSSISRRDIDGLFRIKTGPKADVIYRPGEIISIWSTGNESDPGNGIDVPFKSDSLAFGVFKGNEKMNLLFEKATNATSK